MRTLRHDGHEVILYSGAENMPMKRYQRFNKFIMIDNEVGSSFEDYNRRSLKAIEFLKKGMTKEAAQELDNRRMMVYNSFMEYSPRGRAFAILVHSIDGVEYKDTSSDGLDVILDKLDEIGLSYESLTAETEAVKKKVEKELAAYFPQQFRKTESISYNNELIKKLRLELNQILEGENDDLTAQIEKHEFTMLSMDTPNSWNINRKGNMEIEMETEFVKLLYAISEHTNESVSDITVFKFYALVDFIKEKNKNDGNN
jgi:predicted SprT family Zn-dependent metalloprotease